MKKNIIILGLFSLSFIFLACETKQKEETTNIETVNTTEQVIESKNTLNAAENGKVQSINAQIFKNYIFDYKNNSIWKLQSEKPVVVDFYADWCRPCKIIAPILDELAAEYKDKIHFVKVDTDVETELARQFNISAIPAVMFCPVGGDPVMTTGALDKSSYKKVIQDTFKM
jgi:thioredoxin 1